MLPIDIKQLMSSLEKIAQNPFDTLNMLGKENASNSSKLGLYFFLSSHVQCKSVLFRFKLSSVKELCMEFQFC